MVRVRWLDQMVHRKMTDGKTREARALLKQAAEELNERTRNKHGETGATDSELSDAELSADITALAAVLGLAISPLEAQAAAGAEGAAGEPESPGDPVSG